MNYFQVVMGMLEFAAVNVLVRRKKYQEDAGTLEDMVCYQMVVCCTLQPLWLHAVYRNCSLNGQWQWGFIMTMFS